MAEALDKPTRLRHVEALFYEALQQPPETRAAFLAQRCGEDATLRRDVERLLAADSNGDDFLSTPALGPDFVLPKPESLGEGQPPKRIGPYQLERLLGSGGIGHVWLARRDDEHFQKDVAIKLIKRGMDTDAILDRFRQERQVLARLEHPNIARLIDGGATEDGLPYLVMEYVNGAPMDRYCRNRGLAVEARLLLFLEVCAAVQYAHQNLVVHRDIKPGNILVTAEGRPKLLDFGIAKVLRTEAPGITVTVAEGRLMTPEYASPEQIRGAPITTASDVYSLGVVLYELLTAQLPYPWEGGGRGDLERLICESEPIRPSTVVRRAARASAGSMAGGSTGSPTAALPEGDAIRLSRKLHGDLDTILLTALQKEPGSRYPSVEQFSEDLDRYLRRLPVSARAPTRLYRTRRFVQRHTASVMASSLALLSIVAGLIFSTRAYFRAEAARSSEAEQRRLAQASEVAAVRESARSGAVIRFLEDMLTKANRAEQKGADVTVREVLDNTAVLMESGESKLEPAEAAIVHLTIGRTYLELSLIPQAEKHLRESLDLHRLHLGPEHQGVVQSLHSLGRVLRLMNRLAEAEQCQREVLRISRKFVFPPGAFVAQGLNSLAILLRLQGKLDDAEASYREALDIYRRVLGPDHPGVGDTLSNLATLRLYCGRPADAEPLLRDALSIFTRTQGEDSWEVVGVRHKLAQALHNRGQLDAAVAMMRSVVEAGQRLHGPEHLTTATSEMALGQWLEAQGEWTEAEQSLRAGLTTFETLLGPDHRDVAEAKQWLASALGKLGRWEEGDCLLREAGITPPSESSAGAP